MNVSFDIEIDRCCDHDGDVVALPVTLDSDATCVVVGVGGFVIKCVSETDTVTVLDDTVIVVVSVTESRLPVLTSERLAVVVLDTDVDAEEVFVDDGHHDAVTERDVASLSVALIELLSGAGVEDLLSEALWENVDDVETVGRAEFDLVTEDEGRSDDRDPLAVDVSSNVSLFDSVRDCDIETLDVGDTLDRDDDFDFVGGTGSDRVSDGLADDAERDRVAPS